MYFLNNQLNSNNFCDKNNILFLNSPIKDIQTLTLKRLLPASFEVYFDLAIAHLSQNLDFFVQFGHLSLQTISQLYFILPLLVNILQLLYQADLSLSLLLPLQHLVFHFLKIIYMVVNFILELGNFFFLILYYLILLIKYLALQRVLFLFIQFL